MPRSRTIGFCAATALAIALPAAAVLASGQDEAASRGETLVQTLCSRCHATGRTGDSPFADAPPFREIVKRYPVESLAEALSEGIEVGHPAMPVFEFDTERVEEILAYLSTLKE